MRPNFPLLLCACARVWGYMCAATCASTVGFQESSHTITITAQMDSCGGRPLGLGDFCTYLGQHTILVASGQRRTMARSHSTHHTLFLAILPQGTGGLMFRASKQERHSQPVPLGGGSSVDTPF